MKRVTLPILVGLALSANAQLSRQHVQMAAQDGPLLLQGEDRLTWGHRAPPINDLCDDAIPLSPWDTVCGYTTYSGSVDSGEVVNGFCIPQPLTQSVWFSFEATTDQMFIDLFYTGKYTGNFCYDQLVTMVYAFPTCTPGLAEMMACETMGPDGVTVIELGGLLAGNNYLIQVGYCDTNNCFGSPLFCISIGETEPPCSNCYNPCGAACEYLDPPPSLPDLFATCTGDTLVPRQEGNDTETYCYTFTATGDSVEWWLVVETTQFCGANGSLSAFNWEVYHSSDCDTPIQTGGLFDYFFTNLTVGDDYVWCFTATLAPWCWHSIQWPYLVGGGTLLPIEGVSLRAETLDQQVVLRWQTTSATAAILFTIERSVDAKHFTSIGKIDASSSMQMDYSYSDNAPTPGVNYYRLRMRDETGSETFSEVVAAKVEALAEPVAVEVFTIQGRHIDLKPDERNVLTSSSGAPSGLLDDLDRLPHGVYVAIHRFSDGRTLSRMVFR